MQVLLWRGDTGGAIAAAELLNQFQPNILVGDAAYLGAAYVLADRGADAVRVLEPAVERNSGSCSTTWYWLRLMSRLGVSRRPSGRPKMYTVAFRVYLANLVRCYATRTSARSSPRCSKRLGCSA